MRRNAAFLALILCAALLLPGCAGKKPASSAAPVSSASGAPSSRAALPRESAPSQSAASSRAEVSSGSPEKAEQNGPLKTISTNNKEFNEKFKKNPLDAAYVKEMNGAVSTQAMVDVSNKYSGLWQKEIAHACAALKQALALDSTEKWRMIEADQKQWESGKSVALQKIADDAAAAGGSIAKVNAASGEMDFYRDRAAALYLSLYEIDPGYAYAYQ